MFSSQQGGQDGRRSLRACSCFLPGPVRPAVVTIRRGQLRCPGVSLVLNPCEAMPSRGLLFGEGQPMTHETPPLSADAALRHFRSYFTEPKDVVAHPQLSRDEKLAILREWEQDALRLSSSESEGMGGGEDSMLGGLEESIGVLERSPR